MKFIFIICSLFFCMSISAFAQDLEWGDLEVYGEYKLSQEVVFPGIAEFKAGDKVELMEVTGGGPFIYFQFHVVNCMDPDKETEDSILMNPSPEDQNRDRTVAVTLSEGCNLNIWVETRDYYSRSLMHQ